MCLKVHTYEPFKRKSHKVVKHTQTIRRLFPANCVSVFHHFVGLALQGLKCYSQILEGIFQQAHF